MKKLHRDVISSQAHKARKILKQVKHYKLTETEKEKYCVSDAAEAQNQISLSCAITALSFNTNKLALLYRALRAERSALGYPVIYSNFFTSKRRDLVRKENEEESTLFKIIQVNPVDYKDKILGILNRGKTVEEINLCGIVVAGKHNTFE